jgi:hypothetical protein
VPQLRNELRRRLQSRQKASGYDLYRDDPVGFIEDILGEKVWGRQREIANAVRDHSNVAVPSCFGSGKSWISARIVAWWVATGGIAITTADTFRQVRDILWRELREAHRKGDLPGSIPAVECRWEAGNGAWAIGIKPDDTNREGFQGIHGDRVLTVYDEANGVSAELWEAGRGLATGSGDRRLAIGNPHEPVGPFYEACRSQTWHVIPISVFDTPNFTGERVPAEVSRQLVDVSFVDKAKADGLEGTPWWSAKVLGQFPDTASDQLISLSLVEQARMAAWMPSTPEAAGLDVARFGTDDTVLVEGGGNGPEIVTIVHGQDTMPTAGMGARFLTSRRGSLAIDDAGVGGGVVDRLREQRLPGTILGVNAGSAADNDPEDRFLNMRSQLWWSVREALYRGEISLSRMDEPAYLRLRAELTAPSYRFTSSGRVQIESKDEMRRRGVGSPDLADALCLWYYARSRARRRVASFGAVA